ncbi:hypothetical protein D3C72_722670 [compost metagenome]
MLAVGFGQAVVAVGAQRDVGVQLLALFVKADDVVGTGEHHAPYTMHARGFVQVVDALDVGGQDVFERAFDRHATQVHDGVHALHQC